MNVQLKCLQKKKTVPLKTYFCANVLRDITKDWITLNEFSVNVTWWTLFILRMFPVSQIRQSALLCLSVIIKKIKKHFYMVFRRLWVVARVLLCCMFFFLKKFLANFTISYKETASTILLNIKLWSRKTEMVLYCKTYSNNLSINFEKKISVNYLFYCLPGKNDQKKAWSHFKNEV